MKTSILLFGLSFSYNDSGNAKANKVQGIDVFVYSEPLQDYEVIESGKVINASIKKAAKAGANGVIIHLESSRWEAIKYK